MTKSVARTECAVCRRDRTEVETVPLGLLRRSLRERLSARLPLDTPLDARVCRQCLTDERTKYLTEQLEAERGELSAIEAEVTRNAATHSAIAAHIDDRFDGETTRGQRVADRVAKVGGSWAFVTAFGVSIVLWIVLNSLMLRAGAFDPYPYILLNLGLSCLAAIQAPIIMMSQNRTAVRDRFQADEDFSVNLKAELEVAGLHEKMDHLLHDQWGRMVEIQQTQLDLLEEITERVRRL